jgi:hypothetical protein
MNATVESVPSVCAELLSEVTEDGLLVTQWLVPPGPHALLALDHAESVSPPKMDPTAIPAMPVPPTTRPTIFCVPRPDEGAGGGGGEAVPLPPEESVTVDAGPNVTGSRRALSPS